MTRVANERMDPDRFTGVIEIPVLYGDLDPNKHVNNVTMGRFFEHARVMSHEALGLRLGGHIHFFVARVTIDYVAEAVFGTPLSVGSRLAKLGNSSLTVEQAAWQGATCVAVAEIVMVRVVDGKPTPLPAEMHVLAAGLSASLPPIGRP